MVMLAKSSFFAVALIAASSTSAQAAITVDASDVGKSFTINYNGFVTPDGSGGTLSGLTATSVLTLTSVAVHTFTFNFSILNTSSGPVSSSRVSVFGFDIDPFFNSFSLTPGSVFNRVGFKSNVPNLTGSDDNRICFRAGGSPASRTCAGGGGGGVSIGDAAATGTFALNTIGSTSYTLDRFFVRYQSISGLGRTESATGLGVMTTAVPEPATWGMMIAGFGLVGASLRRRKAVRAFA